MVKGFLKDIRHEIKKENSIPYNELNTAVTEFRKKLEGFIALTKGYDLKLMSSLPENNPSKAEEGKIYLSEDGKYIVRDPAGQVQEGKFDTAYIKDRNLSNNGRKISCNL